jgi:hypothetical protein
MMLGAVVVLDALLVAGLAACVFLFLLAKRDVRVAGKRWAKRQDGALAEVNKLRAELEEIRGRVRDTEENAGLLVAPPPAMSGLNLGKRSQAIRMSRRGDAPGQIAAALRIPEREIELLLKVHHIVLSAPLGEATSQTRG